MELQQIIGFYQVVKQESFTKAAVTTFRTQSALSHQIKSLETELDCKLIERLGRRKPRLTPAGIRFFAFAKSFLEQHERLFEDIKEMKGNQTGRLRIAAQFGPLNYFFPAIIKAYRKHYPLVDLRLFESSPFDTVESVKEGDIDFGLVNQSFATADLALMSWRRAEPCVVTPPGHELTRLPEITFEDLAKFPLILPPKILKYSLRRILEKKFVQKGLKYTIIMEASNFELSYKYVEIDMGIAFAAMGFGISASMFDNVVFTSIDNLFKLDRLALVMRKDIELRTYQSDFIKMLFTRQDGP